MPRVDIDPKNALFLRAVQQSMPWLLRLAGSEPISGGVAEMAAQRTEAPNKPLDWGQIALAASMGVPLAVLSKIGKVGKVAKAVKLASEAKTAEEVTKRVAKFVDPSDPLGTTRHLLNEYDWKPTKGYLSRTERETLEGTPSGAAKLAEYERNMHRMSNLGKAAAAFDEVETVLPTKAVHYRAKLNKLLVTDLQASGAGVSLEKGGESKGVPTKIVSGLQELLEQYEKDLTAAGHK